MKFGVTLVPIFVAWRVKMMKVLVVFCIFAHLTIATPPFTNLLSGGLGGLLGGAGSERESTGSNPLSAISGLIGSGTGRRTLGDVLGVKISLLSALQSAVNGGSQTIDIEGGDGLVDGMGGGLGIEESAGGSSQSFSAGSGFSQMAGIGETSSNQEQGFSSGSGYSNAQQGYSYNRPAPAENTYLPPSSGNGHSSNGGYVYNRPPPPSAPSSYSSAPYSSSSGFAANDASFSDSSASEYSSGSSSLESSSSNDQKIAGGATQSGTAGLSGHSGNGIVGM